MNTRTLLLAALAVFALDSCKKNDASVSGTTPTTTTPSDNDIISATLNLPETPFNYVNISLPFYFNGPGVAPNDNTPVNTNPTTNEGATLGRVLFYDKSLSINNTIACASCHKQKYSFTDPLVFSKGFNGGLTTRNSMAIVNSKYYASGKYFWDERAVTLEDQTLMPIQHPVEMGMNLDSLETRLAAKDYYKVLFRKAFGDEKVTRDRVSKALAQFIRSMISYQSKYDEGLTALGHPLAAPPAPQDNFTNFTAQENQGMHLFQQNCAGPCHNSELQNMQVARNNGLDLVYTDNGTGAITNRAGDVGKFKSPSLRNIALTAPYMHDGRFNTLAEVVEHYNSKIQNNVNLDNRLKDPTDNTKPLRMNLTQQQRDAIVAFLNTLTDNNFVTDVKFSDPFKQ